MNSIQSLPEPQELLSSPWCRFFGVAQAEIMKKIAANGQVDERMG